MAVPRDVARTAVGILGNVISIILFMSPMPTFIQIFKKGSVEQFSPAPYLATLINCGLWVLYGLPMVHPNSILVVTINGAGVVIELVYLLLFLRYSDRRKKLRVLLIMLVECVILAVVALLVLTLAHTTKVRSTTVGSIAMLGNIMMYASPLAIMKMVITTRSVEYMPLSLSLASLANGICWTTYALIRFDPFIAAPNGLGTLFGVAQLVLYATFYKSTKKQVLERQGKGEMGLAATTTSGLDTKKTSSVTQNGHASYAPNGLGILFGLAQIVLYAKFYRSSKIQALEMQGKEEMGLAAITISGIDPEKTSSVAQNSHDSCVHGI